MSCQLKYCLLIQYVYIDIPVILCVNMFICVGLLSVSEEK